MYYDIEYCLFVTCFLSSFDLLLFVYALCSWLKWKEKSIIKLCINEKKRNSAHTKKTRFFWLLLCWILSQFSVIDGRDRKIIIKTTPYKMQQHIDLIQRTHAFFRWCSSYQPLKLIKQQRKKTKQFTHSQCWRKWSASVCNLPISLVRLFGCSFFFH